MEDHRGTSPSIAPPPNPPAPFGVSRAVGNAITGASAGAVVGMLGGFPAVVAGAVIGALGNVAVGQLSQDKSR
jgi:uncharacterized membrane protein